MVAADLVDASGREDVRVDHDHAMVSIPASQASALALIVNELLTDALAAAPQDRPVRLDLAARRAVDDLEIQIALDSEFGGRADGGFGASLIDLLTRQLSAGIDRSNEDGGSRVRLTLPVADRAKTS